MIEDQADTEDVSATKPNGMKDDIFVFRISGALFFGATAGVSTILDRIGQHPRVFILDFSAVPLIDSTGAHALHGFVHKLQRSGTRIYFSGARRECCRNARRIGIAAAGRDVQRQHREREGGRARVRLTRPTPAPPAG